MDLLSILRENGTGLLEGLCRLQNNRFPNYRLVDLESSKKVKMNFSMGTENLGTYEIKVESNDYMVLTCTLITPSVQGPIVRLRITILDLDGDFGKFLAISRH